MSQANCFSDNHISYYAMTWYFVYNRSESPFLWTKNRLNGIYKEVQKENPWEKEIDQLISEMIGFVKKILCGNSFWSTDFLHKLVFSFVPKEKLSTFYKNTWTC